MMLRTMALAPLLFAACASSDVTLYGGWGISGGAWDPVDAHADRLALAKRLSASDVLVIGPIEARQTDPDSANAATSLRWLLVAEMETLAVYPEVSASPRPDALLLSGTVERYHQGTSDADVSVIEVSVRICDGRTGAVLACQDITSHAYPGPLPPDWREITWNAATYVARSLLGLKQGKDPPFLVGRSPAPVTFKVDEDRFLVAAIDAFLRDDFDMAQECAEKVLEADPGNRLASQLVHDCVWASHHLLDRPLVVLKDGYREKRQELVRRNA